MEQSLVFSGVTFDPAFNSAIRPDGLKISFTRTERRVLEELIRRAGTIRGRNQLLDAISGPGSDAAERNIDFVINRLRRKLGDSARKSSFIATHYGDGYSWIAEKPRTGRPYKDAFVVVGPIAGLDGDAQGDDTAAGTFAEGFYRALARTMRQPETAVLDADLPRSDAFPGTPPHYNISLRFVDNSGQQDCILTLREFASQAVLKSARVTLGGDTTGNRRISETTGRAFSDAIWSTSITRESLTPAPDSPPLALGMHSASNRFGPGATNWHEADARIRAHLAAHPEDALNKLMLATNIHTKYVTEGVQVLTQGDPRSADEDEIEQLIVPNIATYQKNEVTALAAAKLLFFLDRGYEDLAVGIAENALDQSVALASSLVVAGQLRCFLGLVDEGLHFLQHALDISEDNPEFAVMIRTLRCLGYLADGDLPGLRAEREKLYALAPETQALFAILLCHPDEIKQSRRAMMFINGMSKPQARGLLLYLHYVYARLFKYVDQRENILMGAMSFIVGRFGPAIVPEEIRASVPALFATLSGE